MKKRWILWVVTIAFIWIIVTRFTQIEQLGKTIATGRLLWILAAAGFQVAYFVLLSGIYAVSFRTVDVSSRVLSLVPVTFASFFLNLVAPTAGASGQAIYVDDAVRRGQSSARAAAGVLLALVTDFVGFTFILLIGLFILFIDHNLHAYEIAASLILILVTLAWSSALLLGLWRPSLQKNILVWAQTTANRLAVRFKRPAVFAPEWADKTSQEFINAAVAIGAHPLNLAFGMLVSIASHTVNILSLFCLFYAFHVHPTFSVLLAGYAMAVLFWIVSITPQGVGVVEGVMALTFTSLNVPADAATVIALSYRGMNIWLPVIIGFFTIRSLRTFKKVQPVEDRTTEVHFAALLTALIGIVNVISAVTPGMINRLQTLERITPLYVRHGSRLTAALAGFALIILASNLWRRKRAAWVVTTVILFVSIITHLFKGLDVELAGVTGVLLVYLLSLRNEFHARSDMPTMRRGLQLVGFAVLFTLIYGTAGLYLQDREYSVRFNLWQALSQTVTMFTQFYNPGLQPLTRFGRFFADSIYFIGAATMGYALLMLVRPVLIRLPASPTEHERAETIIRAYGHTPLARLCLLPDKHYFFTTGGSVVAFVTKGRIALTLGDPIGPESDFSGAVEAFCDYCEQNDWQPVFYQVLPDGLPVYQSAGFSSLSIGEEAVVDLHHFSLEGGAGKPLRTPYNRIARLGYRAEVTLPPQNQVLVDELRSVSDEWLTLMHGTEKQFSLGWFDDAYVRSCPVIAIRAPDGRISAFASILTEYQKNEISIDLMRRRQQIENGTMEFLFVSLIQWAVSQGYNSFSLGLSSLAGVGAEHEDPAIEKALHYIYQHASQFYNFKGLHEFKAKFQPEWSDRYLIYPSTASLPAVAIAMIRADSGDNFIGAYLKK